MTRSMWRGSDGADGDLFVAVGNGLFEEGGEFADEKKARAVLKGEAISTIEGCLRLAVGLDGQGAARALVKEMNKRGLEASAHAAELGECSDGVVAILLDGGANANARDAGGTPALHLAARSGSVGKAMALLNAGARLQARDRDGKTALDVAFGDAKGFLKARHEELLLSDSTTKAQAAKGQPAGGV